VNDRDKENQKKIDADLQLALEMWRRDKVATKYGRAALRNLGPSLVMGEKVRDRIVDCARHGKIETIAHIERETKWINALEFGLEIIKIITQYYPSPPSRLNASQAMSPLSDETQPALDDIEMSKLAPQPAKRQSVTCSLCGMKGHTMRSKKKCPLQNSQKENIAPTSLPSAPKALTGPTHPTTALPPMHLISQSPLLPSLSPNISTPSSSSSLSPIFASTLSSSTLASLSPTTLASLASHFDSISLSRQRSNTA
jgi:hypothetical protein